MLVISFVALAALWPKPRLEGEPAYSRSPAARCSDRARSNRVRRDRRRAADRGAARRLRRLGRGAGQLRADVHPDHLLRSFCPNSSEVQSGAVGLAPPARNTSRRGTSRHQRFSYSGMKRTSMGSLKTTANLKASGKLGSERPFSIAFTVCRETSSASPSSLWLHPRAARSSRMRFFMARRRRAER